MENLLSVWENVLSMAKVTKYGQYCIKERESAIISKIVINFYIVIWFGESSYLVVTISHSFRTHFVFIMAALFNQIQLFGVTPASLTMSAMDNLDFIDPEEEAQMDEEQMQEEEENTIRGAREGGRRGPDMNWRELDR